MAIQKIQVFDSGVHMYVGLSTDTKPRASIVPPGSTFWESDTDAMYKNAGNSWVLSNLQVSLGTALAGERNRNSPAASWLLAIPHGNVTRLDIDTTETLVSSLPCIVLTVTGNDGNVGYTDLIDANVIGGGSTPKYRINCGDGVNPHVIMGRFENGLTVDGESAGHDVTVCWWPL